jgi:branched-chain amino acid transport system ATP-binding protein
MSGDVLSIRRLVKSFGSLMATFNLNMDVRPGEIHAIIGPNGAGKTTLISQLAGELKPDSGSIFFEGRDITAMPIYKRARLGLARSYQISSVFLEFTALANVALAVQAQRGHSFRFWENAADSDELNGPAMEALTAVGLGEQVNTPVASMGHGERRQLELAMVIVNRPKLLLLDEPLAGMSPKENQAMMALLAAMKGNASMVLIEHDMEAVFSLADRISVLVYGTIIACGTPDEIRANEDVRAAYLGD